MNLNRLKQVVPGLLAASILLFSAILNGLFFDRDFYVIHVLLYTVTVVFLIRSAVTRRTAFPLSAVMPWMIAAVFLFGMLIGPLSVSGTVERCLRWLSYGCFLLLAVRCAMTPIGRRWLHYSLTAIGLFIAMWAFLALYQIIDDPHSVQYSQDIRLSSLGMRLAGLLQYANTFGAVCAVLLLYSLVTLYREPGFRQRMTTALPLIPLGAALLLSESRGTWLALSGGWLLGFIVVGVGNRLRYTALSSVVCAVSMTIYARIATAYAQDNLGAGAPAVLFIGLLGLAAVGVLVSVPNEANSPGLSGRISRWLNRPAMWLTLSAASLFASFIQIPDAVHSRLAGHYDTAASRTLFYLDALAIWRESPVFGFGGNSWRTLYSAYQREPYVGREVHSGYLDQLLDTGLVGLALLMLMLGLFAVRVWQRHRAAAPALFVLFGHSAIDFDLSYGFTWLLAMGLLAPALATGEARPDDLPAPALRQSKLAQRWAKHALAPALTAASGRMLPLLMTAVLLAALGFAGRFAYSEAALRQGMAADEPAVQTERLRAAVAANPYAAKTRIQYAAVLQPREAAVVLRQGLHYDPRHAELQWELVKVYAKLGVWTNAEHFADSALQADRFNKALHTEWIQMLYDGMERAKFDRRRTETLERARAATGAYERYALLADAVERMNQPANGKKFAITNKAKLAAAGSYVTLGQYGRAWALFGEVLKTGNEEERRRAQLYMDRLEMAAPN